MSLKTLDHPPPDWFVLTVMRAKRRGWDWVALMVDVDPDEMKGCSFSKGSVAFLWVDPYKHRPGPRVVNECYVRVAGKHRSFEGAADALEDMMLTRH
jgi:hypothetical protein